MIAHQRWRRRNSGIIPAGSLQNHIGCRFPRIFKADGRKLACPADSAAAAAPAVASGRNRNVGVKRHPELGTIHHRKSKADQQKQNNIANGGIRNKVQARWWRRDCRRRRPGGDAGDAFLKTDLEKVGAADVSRLFSEGEATPTRSRNWVIGPFAYPTATLT